PMRRAGRRAGRARRCSAPAHRARILLTADTHRSPMQLVRFRTDDQVAPRIGLHRDGIIHDVSTRFATIASFVAAHPDGWSPDATTARGGTLALANVSLLPPIDVSSTLYFVG